MAESASQVTFIVEEAGCESCAVRVRSALEPLGAVVAIEVDHDADASTVRLAGNGTLSEEALNRALESASREAGHAYRVRPGSFVAAG